jgi:DegV family protein with EDD domain
VTVRIVTDSAADIPPELAASNAITVVPLEIRFGDETFISGVDLSADAFWEKLKTSSEPPATAAPSAGDFQQAFEKLIADGATGIVSLHLSSKLSATYQSAVVAAGAISGTPVEVVDTLAVSAGCGLLAIAAAERAKAGATVQELVAELEVMKGRIRLYGAIDTLEFLRRGGRIGGAQALLGTMLKVKPIISLDDGVVEPVARVRTRSKAIEQLAEFVAKESGNIERLALLNSDAADVDKLIELVGASHPVTSGDVWRFGPVVGTHGGPGLLGLAFITKA